jgi:penicillin-binding protein A
MRRVAAIACVLIAVGLIVYGIVQPVFEETRWILALWLAAPLLLGAIRLALPPLPRGIPRSVVNIGLVVAIGFLMLALQLLRQQVILANTLATYVYVDPQNGSTISNVRRVLEAQKTKRGQIIDRNGAILADSQLLSNDYTLRTYPIADLYDPAAFGNLLGFFSHRYGESGIESSYTDYLSGQRDVLRRAQDSLLGRQHVGDNLRLTIDARIQAASYQALGGRVGSVVVLDAKTGAILSMASFPSIDPRGLAFNPAVPRAEENARIENYWSTINGEGSQQPLLNRPTQSSYPPGSVFKTVTAVAVLEHNKEGQPDQIDCPNERFTEVGAPPVVNAVPNLFQRTGEPTNLERVYAFSCNTAFAEYAMRLGAPTMIETAEKFDILKPEDAPKLYAAFTDLPTVPSVLYVNPGFLERRSALADTGYGQGQLLVTPLQMAMVAAAIANDGVMMRPYLVDRIERPEGGTIVSTPIRDIRRVMSAQTAQKMQRDMRAVVEYGFGTAAGDVPGIPVGGKSGTAEFPCPTPDNPGAICTHAWFIAIAPIDGRAIAIAVMLEGGGEGSGAGAQLAAAVLRGVVQP